MNTNWMAQARRSLSGSVRSAAGRWQLRVWVGAIVLACCSRQVLGAVSYPFVDSFESPTISSSWSMSGTGDVSLDDVSFNPLSSTSVRANFKTLRLDVNEADADGTNCWVFLYAALAPHDDAHGEPPAGTDAGAFYVNTNGQLKARSGANWVPLRTVPRGSFSCYAMHINFLARKWDLYVYTVPVVADTLEKANPTALDFNDAFTGGTTLNSVTLDTELESLMDEVALTAGTRGLGNLKVAPLWLPAGVKVPSRIPGFDYTYDDDNFLDKRLGVDLGAGMRDGDAISVPTETHGFQKFERNAGAWIASDVLLPSQVPITPMTSFVLDRPAGTNTYAFFAYDTLTPLPHPGQPGSKYITGVNNLSSAGYNLLTWPLEESRTAVQDFGIPKSDGDRIYIFTANSVRVLNYNASTGRWREGSKPSLAALSEGQTFWYYRNNAGSVEWDLYYTPNP